MEDRILNKMFTNHIQEHIKTGIYHDQVSFVPEMLQWFYKYTVKFVIEYKLKQFT